MIYDFCTTVNDKCIKLHELQNIMLHSMMYFIPLDDELYCSQIYTIFK